MKTLLISFNFEIKNRNMSKDKIICHCYDVSKSEIKELIRENDIIAFDIFKKYSKAGSKCGKCQKDIEKRIEKYLKKLNNE